MRKLGIDELQSRDIGLWRAARSQRPARLGPIRTRPDLCYGVSPMPPRVARRRVGATRRQLCPT